MVKQHSSLTKTTEDDKSDSNSSSELFHKNRVPTENGSQTVCNDKNSVNYTIPKDAFRMPVMIPQILFGSAREKGDEFRFPGHNLSGLKYNNRHVQGERTEQSTEMALRSHKKTDEGLKETNFSNVYSLANTKDEGAPQTLSTIPPDKKKKHVSSLNRTSNETLNSRNSVDEAQQDIRLRSTAQITTKATYPQMGRVSRMITSRTSDPTIRNRNSREGYLATNEKGVSTPIPVEDGRLPVFETWRDVTDESRVLTQDSFSFMMFVPFRSSPFYIAITVFTIQICIFIFVIKDKHDPQDPKNPFGIPPDVSTQVRASQFLALIIATFTQEDMRTSFVLVQNGFKSLKTYRSLLGEVTYLKYIISVSSRFVMGAMGLVATFLLIVTESTVLELFLNFTAIEFVSQLDDVAFMLSTTGFFRKYAKVCTKEICETEYTNHKRKGRFRCGSMALLLLMLSSFVGIWLLVVIGQKTGYFLCSTIYVQFGDEAMSTLGAFSGLYEKKGQFYREKQTEKLKKNNNHVNETGAAEFFFCNKDSMWTFTIYEPDEEPNEHTRCKSWTARSEKTVFSDLPSVSSLRWYVQKDEREVILQSLSIECLDCESDHSVCGNHGKCDENKMCTCDDDWFGLRCDFPSPCPTMEIDIRDNEFDNGGLREWSNTYTLFKHDNSDGSGLVEVYNRPVYIKEYDLVGGKEYDVMVFTGRRWILFHPYDNYDHAELAEFLSEFYHAYWWKNETVSFISEPVDVGTPTDSITPIGLKWYLAESEPGHVDENSHLLPASNDIQVNLMCAICHNETNPCFHDGVCNGESKRCDCSLGSSGVLCQVPPVRDGKCDMYFNKPEYSYDGGDCCEATCQSGKYKCGQGKLNEDMAFGDIGYPHCEDPTILALISGSSTLSDIVKRGYVRCGVSDTVGFMETDENGEKYGFEADICRAIGAAALNDPAKVEFVSSKRADRFKHLAEEKYDVLLRRTSITAQRDVHLLDLKTGFSFSAPYFYDGLRYAGIPTFRECADNNDSQSAECIKLKICVVRGTTWLDVVSSNFPSANIVSLAKTGDYVSHLNNGFCNVIAAESIYLFSIRRDENLVHEYDIGSKTHSKEAKAAWTKQNDRIWSKFVSSVIEALIQAEQLNITKLTAKEKGLSPTVLFGDKFVNMFQNAIAATGNYGEIYQKHMQAYVPRQKGVRLNMINNGTTGLLYSLPLGTGMEVPDLITGRTLEIIRKRGVLNCGVMPGRIGLCEYNETTSQWSGFEVDICKGIAAALFKGVENVDFKDMSMSSSLSSFEYLQNDFVDIVVAGFSHTLEREINETSTGKGFDFSPTYFYDGLQFGGQSPYVICADHLIFDDLTLSPNCINTKICVLESTTWLDEMKNSLEIPEANIVQVYKMEEAYTKLASGECNVIAGESFYVSEQVVRSKKYPTNADYHVGENKYSVERLAVVSQSEDAQFSDFIRWIIFGLFYAAEEGITKDSYYRMPAYIPYFGDNFVAMWQHLIKARGNYNEIFDANLEEIVPREGLNQINKDNNPQMYANVGVKMREEDF